MMNLNFSKFLLLLLLLCSLQNQGNGQMLLRLPKPEKVRLFPDCNAACDLSYMKTEINFVDFAPDRFTSNVYVLITAQMTGSGGQEIRLFFEGQDAFAHMNDTLVFYRNSMDTDDEYRKHLIQYLKLGLARYLAQTETGAKLLIQYPEEENNKSMNSTLNTKDKWNFWVFNIGANGNLNSNDNSRNYSVTGRINASRVTEKMKISLGAFTSQSQIRIIYDGDTSVFGNHSQGVNFNVVRSLSEHWSAGGVGSYALNTYSNDRSNIILNPAIEYSFFKYQEAVKKSVTLFYQVGPMINHYFDSGYYDLPAHVLMTQTLSLQIGLTQKWGTVSCSSSWNSFLNNFSLNKTKISGWNVHNISISGNVDVRLFKGLSFNTFCFANFTEGIYPNIPRKNFTRDDLLTSTRQYPTARSLYLYMGLNYRFGSIYNNVVNPRFNGNIF